MPHGESSEQERFIMILSRLVESFCPGIMTLFEQYAQQLNGQLDKWIENNPAWVIIWQKDQINYTLSFLLEDQQPQPMLTLWIAKWQQKEDTGNLSQKKERKLTVPTSAEEIKEAIQELLSQELDST